MEARIAHVLWASGVLIYHDSALVESWFIASGKSD